MTIAKDSKTAKLLRRETLWPGERLAGCAFVPRLGEKVEFRSDQQTEKGPSAGLVIAVDHIGQTATIRHSDNPGETFRWGDVRVEYFTFAHDGKPLWVLS
jgi:hypothetical protein